MDFWPSERAGRGTRIAGSAMANFDLNFSYPCWMDPAGDGQPHMHRSDPSQRRSARRGELQHQNNRNSLWVSPRPVPWRGQSRALRQSPARRPAAWLVEATPRRDGTGLSPKVAPGLASATGKDCPTVRPQSQFFGPPSPVHNVQAVADRAADALHFCPRFGDYPYESLALTQAPGPTSKAGPSLVFYRIRVLVSTGTGLRNLRPADAILARQLQPHETAHQWWALVPWKSYRDHAISEGLASYCALLDLERKDPAAFRTVSTLIADDLLQMSGGPAHV